jgi:hypothetical protein
LEERPVGTKEEAAILQLKSFVLEVPAQGIIVSVAAEMFGEAVEGGLRYASRLVAGFSHVIERLAPNRNFPNVKPESSGENGSIEGEPV